MCGEEAIDRLRLVSTMWDKVDLVYGTKLQDELENMAGRVFKERLNCEKFQNTPASAWAIVEGLGDEKKVLSLQRKVVDDRIDPQRTSGHLWTPHPSPLAKR
ncbi:hypothetical protein EDC04DRAFT_2612926 [Pisolithus marmoratus]|nr:hypothetical protein EDC04DRAFT_2612926 [Pisolithus marmoratus]